MSKDLEEGEIEEGELLGEVADASAGLDEPGELSVPPSEPVKDKPDPSQDSVPTTVPVDDTSTAPVPPSDLGLLGLPTYDAPFRSYGSSMAYSAYGALPYAAMAPAQLLDRRQSSIRDRQYASTSYDSPRFARRQSGGSFASRQSDHRGYSPPRTHSRYEADFDESSSFDSRQADSVPSEDESMDEGELRPVSRSLETVSLDLKAALSDLEDLQQALSTSAPVRADDNTQLADMGTRFFKGLSAVHLVCNTGVGKISNLSAAGKLVRASIAKQDMLLTASQKKELEGWTRSSKVFKALVHGEEESIQPKKPKAEPQPRTTYVPKQPQASGQKRQGKQGSQQGPKGKKQKKAAAAADLEDAPPLPPSDAPPSDDSAAEAAMEGVESVPLPPLPPPSPDPLPAGSAMANGYSSGHTDTHQAAVSRALPGHQPAPQQSGYGTDPMTDPVTAEPMPEPDRSSIAPGYQQYEVQLAQPAVSQNAVALPPAQGLENGLAGLAETGGPVALANRPAPGAEAGIEVLADDVKSLLRQRKLCLVLDLDHTLINSARFGEVEPEHEALLRSHLANDAVRLPEEKRELFRLERIQMWTKLRPAVRHFLETAHQHFELWIHTNGNRSYATAIVEVLDPSGRLFGHRIISQGAAGEGVQQDLTKRLMQGLEGREPVALVVDDTSSVWGNHEENLVAVERYIYFPASRRQFGSKAKSLLEMRRDETPQSGMLMTALSVLLRTHARMFSALNQSGGVEAAGHRLGQRPLWDVRQVLQDERKQVLAGVHIMFSRVIPLQDGHPEWHPMWRKAVKFGATCTTQPSDAVTHVAAYVNGTEKVYWAQRTGKFVVTPD
ncbi:MAG: RNA polymerase II C-terminal domain phosphatase-like 3-like, partial [Trebouxia sp. A1-2]